MALGAAAYFTVHTQQQVDQRRAALRLFESSARDAADALDDAQAGQQAYVGAGQDPQEWRAKVGTFLQTASTSIDTLRASALSAAAGPALLEASTALTQLRSIDTRALDQVNVGDVEAAASTIFSAAADAVGDAVSNVDTALGAEQQAAADFEARQRRVMINVAGGATSFSALALLLLALARPKEQDASSASADEQSDTSLSGLSHLAPASPAPTSSAGVDTSALDALATICTNFGRVRQADDLKGLLEEAAALMHARGVIVWLGSATGADLRPVLAHGYSEATLAHIPVLPRSADNAAAHAYRDAAVQIVRSRPGGSQGAIVAPLLTADGCIGALTAEIRDGEETREQTRALAVILASQLAGVLAAAAEANAGADARTAAL